MSTKPKAIHFSGDPEADQLLAESPLALLIGFALDQQITVQQAFSGPLKLKQRLGHLDAAKIAALDPEQLNEVFREKPAVHRFPGNMAKRVHDLCSVVAGEYQGDAARVWTDAKDTTDLEARIRELPGFGDMKVIGLGSTLAKQLGVKVAEPLCPDRMCLGDVDSPEALEAYQAAKRARRAARRAETSTA